MESLLNRFPALERLSIDNLLGGLSRLSSRERNLVLGALGALFLFVGFLAVRSGVERLKNLETQVETNRTLLTQVRRLSASLGEKQQQSIQLRSRVRPSSGFYLSSYLEGQAARFRITLDNLGTESRQDLGDGVEEVSTDVKIAAISYPKMLNLLAELENSPDVLLRVKRIRIKTLPNDPIGVELSFKISAYLLKS